MDSSAPQNQHSCQSPRGHFYEPRWTRESDLWKVLQEDIPELIEQAKAEDPSVRIPIFVEKQLMAMVSCGDYVNHGFMMLQGEACNKPRAVPFS